MGKEGEKILDRWNSMCKMPVVGGEGHFQGKEPSMAAAQDAKGVLLCHKAGDADRDMPCMGKHCEGSSFLS